MSGTTDYQKEHDNFEQRMDIIRRAQMNLGQTYRGDLEGYLTRAIEKRNIEYTKTKGKVTDQHIIIASGVNELDEITLLINPPKKGILAGVAGIISKKDDILTELWKQIYTESRESRLSPLIRTDSSIEYVQAAEDGKYKKVVSIKLSKLLK